ncbi:RNA-directed DNA polymerase from mobile element jockey [Trichonephila clavipes]|nr:RNA-directed DNA polymerase from mobile element jockey [Trichonephila clavipes]
MLKSAYLTLAFRHDLLVDTPLRWMQGIYENSHSPTCDPDAPRVEVRAHGEKYATRTLNILQLNINGTQRKIEELTDEILNVNKVHIACLQETKLNSNLKLKIKGFTTLRKDRKDRAGGGLAFLVKSADIKFREIILPPTTDYDENSTEVQAITVLLPQQEVTIINAYHPDNSDINLDLLNTLLDTKSGTKILLGDLNAKSPSWGSRTLDLKGSQIEDLLCDNDLSILNDKRSTYLSKTNGTTSALDITAINHQTASQATWKILKSAISDHFPIITSINKRVDGTIQSKRSWNFRKANWGKFTSELEMLCSLSSPHTLDERLQSFASHINAAAKRSIPRVKRRNDWVPFWKDTNIENLINERDKLSAELQKNNTETNKIRLTNLCHEVEEVISSCKRKKWTEFCETLDPPKISQHWKVIKTLNNHSTHQKADILTNIISSSGRDAATNKETASLLAKHYENKSKLTFNANDRKLLRTYRKTIQDSKRYNHKNIFTIPFLMEELESAIAKMNPGKAPGPDVIFGRMVQHFGNLAKKELLEIFNLSWATGKLPQIWKLSTVIPILKPNKNASECKNYRPISLTSTLCKLMERVIHRRLMNWLIENKKLHFYQTAFRTHHSTTDQLFYLNQSIIDGFQEKPHKKTLAVFLDISAAFDRVWRQKLVHTIQGTGINGKALLWISDFLRGRKFSVRFNGALSESRRMWAGVPQGSVLSPLLFLIFMNTIHHHIHPDTNIACYADDIAVWHSHNDITESEKALNTTLKGIAEWTENLKLTINADKTNYCIFSTDRRHRSSFNANIKIQNSQIKNVDLPTYLGVTLDPELRFSKHIEHTTNKALGKLNILRKLCGTSWGSRPQTLKSTFCTVIRPVLEYATPIWTPASISAKRKLDSVQHRAAKIIIEQCHQPIMKRPNKNAACLRLKAGANLPLSSSLINYAHMEPLIPKNPPKNICFELELFQPCSKKEDPVTLRQKGLETIAILSQDNFAIAYTDGSSDRSLSNGGAGIILLLPDGNNYKHKISTGIIASNFTSELVAIREAIILYQQNPHVIDSTEGLVIFSDSKSAIGAIRNGETNISCDIITLLEQLHNKRKSCILQWIPAHVNIEVTEFDCPRIITSTIARLRTEHLKGMKIHPDKTRSYVQCKHCPDLQLTPNHILECRTVATKLLKMGMVPVRDSLRELLYSPDAPRIAEAVIKTFDGI